jgi:hypothetical protein
LETGLRREKGTFLGLDYTFIKAIESSNIKAYFTKRTPNMGGSISGAKYIQIFKFIAARCLVPEMVKNG